VRLLCLVTAVAICAFTSVRERKSHSLVSMVQSDLQNSKIGFVGCGTMSAALVRGLCTLPAPPSVVTVSPRNARKASALFEEFPQRVRVAKSNQQVVDQSDVVFIGVLPAIAEDTVRSLKFKPTHTVISLVSTAQMEALREWCVNVPASNVVRAIPLPPVAKHKGATVLTPQHPLALAIFEALGTPVAVESEAEMKKLMTISTLMGQFYAQQRAAQQWLEGQGIEAALAAKYIGAIYHCISYDSRNPSAHTFDELVSEQTAGGLNEQVVRELTEAGAFTALTDSLDGALARIEGRPAPKRNKRPYSSLED